MLYSVHDLMKASHNSAVHYINKVPSADDPEELWVLGDTHGQLNDVLWIFHEHGPPSSTRTYLFNGDIADRGDSAVEILLLLFAYKLVWPESVFINRGNHEAKDMNEMFGFSVCCFQLLLVCHDWMQAEVRRKYKGTRILSMFQAVFDSLPLCTVVGGKIFVVHGGIPR